MDAEAITLASVDAGHFEGPASVSLCLQIEAGLSAVVVEEAQFDSIGERRMEGEASGVAAQ